MSYLIEKNIPLCKDAYPFPDMEDGDSFLVECDPAKISSERNKVWSFWRRNEHRFGGTIVTRAVGPGMRVWWFETDPRKIK